MGLPFFFGSPCFIFLIFTNPIRTTEIVRHCIKLRIPLSFLHIHGKFFDR